ncbi:MAG: putative transcriptional regulator [Yoonia sp.]|jgi:putative transcriptional regulator
MEPDDFNLVGKLLIAMPDMGDPRFDRSVIYICAHSEEGAMGLIVNKPQPKLRFINLLKQLDIEVEGTVREARVHYGGPVETVRGFVLHTDDYRTEGGTVDVADHICMTSTMDVLQDLARGKGPDTALLAIGYAGWGEGQLEGEIFQNGWLTCDADPDIIFGIDNDSKWTDALAILGVSPALLSSSAGRA